MIKTKGEKVFHIAVVILMVILCFSIIIPIINLLAVSFSSEAAINAGLVKLKPVDFTLENYQFLLEGGKFSQAFKISVLSTVIGTAIAMIVTTLCAYAMSKPKLRGRKKLMLFFVFTLMFSGGIVPSYMLMKALGIYNTFWVLVLPMVFSTYNMILLKNFMEGLPDSLDESARIDGASDFQVFKDIVLPLSKPAIATISLFYAVAYWNSYFPGTMYITDQELKPLQSYIYEMQQITELLTKMPPEQQSAYSNISTDGITTAAIVAATIPILIVYPFLQKHFVGGIVVGSEK